MTEVLEFDKLLVKDMLSCSKILLSFLFLYFCFCIFVFVFFCFFRGGEGGVHCKVLTPKWDVTYSS